MSAAEWRHSESWRMSGRDFMIEVNRHEGRVCIGEGPNRWCVYAYIYPPHPYFASFNGPDMFQDAACRLPLHCGPSLLEYPMYDGKVTCVRVGCDYSHLHDSTFTHMATREDAYSVFADAQELHDYLSAKAVSA